MSYSCVYLGHVISADGIFPNLEKVRAVKVFRNPTNVQSGLEIPGSCGILPQICAQFC